MVTSTAPGEGKSVTAANLAIAMALDGKKVILVDCDLRRPTVHEKFGIRGTPGLTNVLVGAMDLDLGASGHRSGKPETAGKRAHSRRTRRNC